LLRFHPHPSLGDSWLFERDERDILLVGLRVPDRSTRVVVKLREAGS
jgi:hypothetical protein